MNFESPSESFLTGIKPSEPASVRFRWVKVIVRLTLRNDFLFLTPASLLWVAISELSVGCLFGLWAEVGVYLFPQSVRWMDGFSGRLI